MSSAAVDDEGLDGTPIKSVSSLRSRFENMGKFEPAPAPPPVANPAPVVQDLPQPHPPRSMSPTAKLDWPRDSKPNDLLPPPTRLRETPPVSSLRTNNQQELPMRSSSPRAPPRPPVVNIQPPQSPPKKSGATGLPDPSNLLNPDSSSAPITSLRSPNQSFPEQRKTPRATGSKPPSPPPPRRSSETRRPPPPPVNRADKPAVRPKPVLSDSNGRLSALDKVPEVAPTKPKTSPFSSPPGSAAGGEDDGPPPMPSRPRPEPTANLTLIRSRSLHVGSSFEPPPPPLHPASAGRRRDREDMTTPKPMIMRQLTGPSASTRSPSIIEPPPLTPRRPHTVMSTKPPPPRPPRPHAPSNSDATQRIQNPHPLPHFQRPPVRGHQSHHSVVESHTYAEARTPTSQTHLPPPPRITPAVATTNNNSGTISTFSAPLAVMATSAPVQTEPNTIIAAYPDIYNVNRQPPFLKPGIPEITTKYDARVFDVCGEYVACGGSMTRAWSMFDGSELLMLPHAEGIRGTALAFKPAANPDDEGTKLWVGTNFGEIQEIDLDTKDVVCSKPGAHGRHEVIKIFRFQNQLWSLDESGILQVWGPDKSSVPNLSNSPSHTYRLPRGHTFSLIIGGELWYASGKDVYVFAPTLDGSSQCQLTPNPMCYDGAGEIVSGATIRSDPDKVYLGHSDGKVSVYSRKDYSLLSVASLNAFKINTLGGVSDKLWAGFNSGKIAVYDVTTTPWTMKKEWHAHDNPVIKLIPDAASVYRMGRFQVVSLGADNKLRAWDGLLKEDATEDYMRSVDTEYCDFDELDVHVLTWNAGASTPSQIQHSTDSAFFTNLIKDSGCPDILVFGFQELVDLEDKTATAKRLFKSSKKKDDKKDMSHAYRDWRDFLQRSLDDYMPSNQPYYVLHTATLVGLFTCIFVKASLRDRIHDLYATDVKRGMGGYHGNKGAIVIRFMIDDSSLCFVNCHLAAGQTQANSRHNDVAAILEGQILPIERNAAIRPDHYVGGGDGTMVMDHELCLWNGDLNYRIDAMSRDTVVMAVKNNNLGKLLERDQLLVAKRRNPSFKLRAFHEMPIEFAPTYKYDVGTDNYDTSEKKRSPAWCDRLLHRGHGRIQQLEYRRHEVRASDHRPVSGRFKFYVKEIDHTRKAATSARCAAVLDDIRISMEEEEK
ncbi:hypothetical protein Cpir12675_006758 [Ceratocystis pirilliformis]|uniref:Inositol polyphosphate-related phosphatase domain-containing protein n=1 Tax=Ceratocystis pirilliformis TaxID=259994 RepID=A0ABR3YFD1_9PEZI